MASYIQLAADRLFLRMNLCLDLGAHSPRCMSGLHITETNVFMLKMRMFYFFFQSGNLRIANLRLKQINDSETESCASNYDWEVCML